jgi:ribosomal protein S18 acetylase RimI-like enzyme
VNSNVAIRAVRANEWLRVRDIRLRALEESPDAFGAAFADERSLPDRVWIERTESSARREESAAFLAETTDGWIGFVMARLDDEDRTRAGMFGLWVDPASRATGVGLALTEAVIEWARARGASTLALWVVASNLAAIELYRRVGFDETGNSMPMPRKPDLREIRMEKDLVERAGERSF